jgi:hypothetical protein
MLNVFAKESPLYALSAQNVKLKLADRTGIKKIFANVVNK